MINIKNDSPVSTGLSVKVSEDAAERFKNLCATDLKTLISKDRVIPPRGTKDSASWVQAGELLQSMSAFPDAEQGHQLAVRGINAVQALIKPMASSNRNGKDDADVNLPSPNEIYASASFATKAALYSGSQEVGAYVLEELLHVAELCVNVAMELPLTVKEAGNVALQLACASARNVKQLILRYGYERSMTLQDAATRLQLLVLASAHLYELEFAVSRSSLTNNSMDLRLWAWDIASPLDRDERLDPTKYPAECLLRVFMEAFAVLFATAWTFQSSDVRNAFIPLATAFSERESVMLLLGRLMNVVEGDEEISRLLLPLLTDTLAARAAELSTRTYAVAAHVLASMAASCAQGGNQWGYRLVVDLLIKLYKFPQFSISASLLFGKSSPHPEALSSPMSTGAQVAVSAATSQGPQSPSRHVPGALSFALKVLADGLVAASLQYRKDYCRRLLSLFSDFALLLPNESYIRDLGALLPAIAAILPTLQEKRRPSSSATGGFGLSSTSLSLDTLSTLQDEGRTFNASLRHLWLYSSIYDFGMIAGGVGNSDDAWPSPWSQALSSIASATPVLILGSEQQKPEAFLEDISVEYESWLVKLKKRGEGTNLMKQLYKIIGSPAGGGSLSAPLAAHVLSIAYKSQCIASYHPSYGCSVEPVLEHMRHSLTTATEYPWLKQTLSIVFSTQMQTLKRYLASPVRSEEKDMYAADLLNATLEVLTPFLISHGPYNDVPNSAFDLLTDLTRQYPALLFEDRALSSAFQAITMAAANDNDSSLVRKYVLDLVKRAASISPGPAEALVVETLRHMAVREWRQPEIAVRFTPAVVQAVDQGRRLCSLPDVSRPYTGFIAWSAKVNAMGSINGLNTAESCVGGLPGGAAACCGRFLIDAFRDAAPDRLIIPKFIQATAVIVGNEISPLTAHLLRLVTWGQLLKFDSEIMAAATMCWHWLLAAGNTEVKTLVMESLVSAWISSRDEKMGMFRRKVKVEESDIQGVRAHHAWVVFFLEIWVAHRYDVQMTSSPFQNAIHKLLDSSICSMEPILISDHHITLGARFRLLQLALNFAGFIKENGAVTSTFAGSSATQIFSRTLFNALSWFAQPISWFESKAEESLELVAAMQDFADELSKAMTIFIGDILPSASGQSTLEEQGLLLKFLLKIEIQRLTLWAAPLVDPANRQLKQSENAVTTANWPKLMAAAWNISPSLALAFGLRFPAVDAVQSYLVGKIASTATDPSIQILPKAVRYLIGSSEQSKYSLLASWATVGLSEAIHLMTMPSGRHPLVVKYVLRSLQSCDPEEIAFFLPQLVQSLRHDPDGLIERFLLEEGRHSVYFAYLLESQLASEGTPPPEAFNPSVKRSNWSPPVDTGLWTTADRVRDNLWKTITDEVGKALQAEVAFFKEVTDVSGKLYPIPKAERKSAAEEFTSNIAMPEQPIFMPTDSHARVISIKPESATPMQSAAKCPILVAFEVEKILPGQSIPATMVDAAIFKVGDDCRQDLLALQVIALLKRQFDSARLHLPLVPYGVVPTGHECGIIQVVPRAKSRAQLGELTDGGLFDIFQREFGFPGSPHFEAARSEFISSCAGYAVASFILQAKDRHNGNIMLDNRGRIIHIDFGYILGISPGGNMGFESAAFKLSYEMTQLLDPGNSRNSEHFIRFQELCVKGYLAARTIADQIIDTVAMSEGSKLPCFSRGGSINALRKRFHLEMTDSQAAVYMRRLIMDAYDKWTTGVYDLIQYYQNRIPK